MHDEQSYQQHCAHITALEHETAKYLDDLRAQEPGSAAYSMASTLAETRQAEYENALENFRETFGIAYDDIEPTELDLLNVRQQILTMRQAADDFDAGSGGHAMLGLLADRAENAYRDGFSEVFGED